MIPANGSKPCRAATRPERKVHNERIGAKARSKTNRRTDAQQSEWHGLTLQATWGRAACAERECCSATRLSVRLGWSASLAYLSSPRTQGPVRQATYLACAVFTTPIGRIERRSAYVPPRACECARGCTNAFVRASAAHTWAQMIAMACGWRTFVCAVCGRARACVRVSESECVCVLVRVSACACEGVRV